MTMKFLANENIPLEACRKLKEKGIDIVSIAEFSAGASDKEVISLALKEKRSLITFDKDFGELVYKQKVKVAGIVLLRFSPKSPGYVFEKLAELLDQREIPLKNHFVVVEDNRVRSREIK